MEIYISQQCLFFFLSILFGVCAGLFFDVFRIARIAVKHPSFFVAAEDFFFCISVSSVYIIFVFCANNGALRWFSFFGAAMGFYIYFVTVGRIVMKFSQLIINFIKSVIKFIRQKIFHPVFSFIFRILRYLKRWFVHLFEYISSRRRARICRKAEESLIICASKGFNF